MNKRILPTNSYYNFNSAKGLLLIVSIIIFLSFSAQSQDKKPIYLDDNQPIEQRIEDALSRMTLDEKIAMLHAQSKFSSKGVARLGIPELWTSDGPHGIRPEVLWDEWVQAAWTNDSCTVFPALTCLAASWNEDMSLLYGRSIGAEARYRDKDILLGPGVNIYRSPLNGRNFEYMGEDPFLASKMVVPYIKGVQEYGVATCVKHFALNNQETNRHTTNVNLGDRALYEIYLPAFKAAVIDGGSWSIMGAYNLYKGQHACHNEYLLKDILRDEWGFDGVVVSDWGGTHDTLEAIYNGLDLEFGTWTDGLTRGASNSYDNYYLARPYRELIKSGKVGTEELDQKVRNILRLIFRTAMNRNKKWGSFGSEEHALASRRIAEDGIVLLQNNGDVLPINPDEALKIAVIGENAIKMMTVGGGSSSLKAKYEISVLEGIKNRIEPKAEVTYARGYVGDASGNYNGVVTGQDLSVSKSAEELFEEAVALAKKSDYVIFVGGLNKSPHQDCEDADRKELELPYIQDSLIIALAKVNKNLIVVNISGNAVAMPWVKEVPAIVQGWYLGTEAGNAIASVLFGDVNPSGKLPFTFPVKLEDNAAHAMGEFPGKNGQVNYNEGILIGYRWHDTKKIKPLFCFGHGLSYTEFEYSDLSLDKKKMNKDGQIVVSLKLKNTGDRAGSEVVQLYIADKKSSLPRPAKELKAFKKVALSPGEEQTVKFTINKTALSYFDDKLHEWVAEPGKFEAIIAASSSDIKGKLGFTLIND